jgi:hypothetical protein
MRHLAALALVFWAACDSTGSGLPGDKKVVQLSADEDATLCQYFAAEYPARMIDCGNGNTQTVNAGTVADCVSGVMNAAMQAPSCPATVAQAEECEKALYDEPDAWYCAGSQTPPIVCAPLANCASGPF